MSIKKAFTKGIQYVLDVKKWLFLILLIQFLIVVFPGIYLKNSIHDSLRNTRAAENMVSSFDARWHAYFSENARGLESSFFPAVDGIGAFLEPLNQFISGNLTENQPVLIGLGIIYTLIWIFFLPGLLSRFREFIPHEGFFTISAKYFLKVLFISLIALFLYYLIFSYPFSWLSNLVKSFTRETIDERIVFLFTILKYLIIWFLIVSVNMISDYAKIQLVVRETQGLFNSISRAISFVFGFPAKTYGLYFLNVLILLIAVLFYWLIVPQAGHSSGWMILISFLLGQLFILCRIGIRSLFLASQSALCSETER